MTDLSSASAGELAGWVRDGRVSASEVAEAMLHQVDALEGSIHAFRELDPDAVRQQAAAVDGRDDRTSLPLAGVPIAIKDALCTRTGTTAAGSRMLADYRSPIDATCVQRLVAAGAVLFGKTNMDEFAMGSSCETSYFGPTRNPWDPNRVPGGSSGGSAAAVAAGMCPVSLGSDTGGSIRQPAALCGVVGMKPTYGRISRNGLVAFASSLDQVGPFSRCVEDAALLLGVMSGPDPLDSTSSPWQAGESPGPDVFKPDRPPSPLRVGLPKQYLAGDANDPAVTEAVDRVAELLRGTGATLLEVDLPHTRFGIPVYYVTATAEASSNLARYDGVHFGHRADPPFASVEDLYSRSRAEGFGPEVQRRVMLGTYALSSGYYDAYYDRACRVRRLIQADFQTAFRDCDVLLCPTTTGPAFPLGEKADDPLSMYLNDIYTVNANLAGLPGISLPAGFAEADGRRLPVGVQLLGPAFSERSLLSVARLIESELPTCLPAPAAASG